MIEERVPQEEETPAQAKQGPSFAYRYAYARSADTRAANDRGQDYLTFWSDEGSFIFALCDGVSQSFFGDLAAVFLGDALVHCLKQLPKDTADSGRLSAALTTYLRDLTPSATEAVRSHPLPETIIPMMRDVLEQKRAGGSETTFVCGRIDRPSRIYPDGRMVLAWLGDSRLRFWRANGEATREFGDTFQTRERWSSLRGPVGSDPHVYIASLGRGQTRCLAVMAYSDGLASLDPAPASPSSFMLQDLIDRAGESATSDDISFLEIWLDGMPQSVSARPVAAPQIVSARTDGARVLVDWRRLAQISRYQVELRDRHSQIWNAEGSSWTSPPLEPALYQVRVRGVNGSEPGLWSKPAQVTLAAAAPPPTAAPLRPAALPQPLARPRSLSPRPSDVRGYAYPSASTPDARSNVRPWIIATCLLLVLSFVSGLFAGHGLAPSAPKPGTAVAAVPGVTSPQPNIATVAATTAATGCLATGGGVPSGTGWSCLAPSAPPLARQAAAMASGPNGTVVLFGGRNGSTYIPGTWIWDGKGGSWSQDYSTKPAPPGRWSAALAQASPNQVVLFGGTQDDKVALGDTWIWDGSDWTQRQVAGAPPARFGAAMAPGTAGTLLLMGGSNGDGPKNDTWIWRSTGWMRQAPAPHGLTARQDAAMARNGTNDPTLLFGGRDADDRWLRDTWKWNGSQWEQIDTSGPALVHPHMVYDAAQQALVLVGKANTGGGQTEVWRWNGSKWERTGDAASPVREIAGIADVQGGGLLAFGGLDGAGKLSDQTMLLRLPPVPTASPTPAGTPPKPSVTVNPSVVPTRTLMPTPKP